MSFKPKPAGSNFPPVPAGTHHAICYSIVDIGTHYNEKYDKTAQKVIFTFELPDVRIDIDKDGEKKNLPRAISQTYTLSFHEKANLTKDITAWRGKPIGSDEEGVISGRLGENCLLTITNTTKDGRTYANIAGIAGLMSSMTPKKPENPAVIYEIESGEPPEAIPQWIRDRIKESKEFQAMSDNAQELPCDYTGSEPTPGDDIPF